MKKSCHYNKDELLNLLDVARAHTVYSIIGRMESLISFFDKHPDFDNINPFLKTYYFVTKKVADKYLNNKSEFEDFDALERLDIIFASQFFVAFKNLIDGKKHLKPWHTFFEYCLGGGSDSFLKMLLGINAHINGDLALSLFEAKSKSTKDFLKINGILLEVIPSVMKELTLHDKSFFGLGALLFKDLTKTEFEKTVVVWRNNAWKQYQQLSKASINKERACIHENAERVGQELISAFSNKTVLGTPFIISEINKVKP